MDGLKKSCTNVIVIHGLAVEVTPTNSSTFEDETNYGESSQKCVNIEGAAEKITTPQILDQKDDTMKSPADLADKVPGLKIESGEIEMQQQQQDDQYIPNKNDSHCTNLSNGINDWPK